LVKRIPMDVSYLKKVSHINCSLSHLNRVKISFSEVMGGENTG